MDNSFELGRGRIFVGGLHWQALSGGPSEAKSETQKLAKHLNFDLAVWRTSGAHKVGLASTKDGYKPGMLSAAAVISKTIEVESGERDFLCATELPDGRFLYVAQSDGVIMPDGDFIGTAESVCARMLDDMSIGKSWNMVIAPDMWGISESVERDFESFVPRKGGKLNFRHRWWALRPVKANVGSVTKSMMPFAVIGGALIAGIWAYQQWQESQSAKEAARLAMLQAESETPTELPHPWKDKPRAQIAAASCATAFEGIPNLWPGNWTPESVLCAPGEGSIRVSWRRGEHGWIKHLLEVEPHAAISPDGTMASRAFQFQAPGTEDEALVDGRERSMHLYSMAQQYGIDIVLAEPPPLPQMPGATPDGMVVQMWRELSWAIKGSALSPESVVAALDGAGFRLNSVTARFSDGLIKWDLEGSQYVLP